MATLVQHYLPDEKNNAKHSWPLWPLNLVLGVLFFGPIISPLFRATAIPFISDAGLLARDLLATYVCPTPAKSYMIAGLPMAVCARCWGATIGLLLARALFTQKLSQGAVIGSSRLLRMVHFIVSMPFAMRLLVCAVPFLLWPLEIIGEARGWWVAPFWLLLANGVQAGAAAGIFFCSLWPGLQVREAEYDAS